MLREMLSSVVLFALIASTQGRAVNISNTWVLPEEGFPVFYRYFRDRISWYEADAVCQFHHANLVTVDTTAQYDAVRAYLKELDISSAVWVGLIRSNPDGDFTWTDYRGLSSDGYWSSAPDARAAPLCAAADPAADYRWQALACGGPTVASFICELPVPQWALGNEGCMVKALPALTVLYLPESAAVQLTADCGLASVKRVQCTGNVKRENLLRNLSCNEDDLTTGSDAPTVTTTEFALNFTDEDMTTDATSEESVSGRYETVWKETDHTPSPQPAQSTSAPVYQDNQEIQFKTATKVVTKLNNISYKNVDLDNVHDNNLQSNYIPKNPEQEDLLSLEKARKLEDEKNMQHKLLHDELARHGNFETIFNQPSDHFVPPLVMARAKVSDDMTVLSLAEKHAQQLADQHSTKHVLPKYDMNPIYPATLSNPDTKNPEKAVDSIMDKPIVMTMQPNVDHDESKKDKIKLKLPKKYLSKENYDGMKAKPIKIDNKMAKFEKLETITATEVTTSKVEPTNTSVIKTDDINDDASLELTVELTEPSKETVVIQDSKEIPTETMNIGTSTSTKPTSISERTTSIPIETSSWKTSMENIAMNHEVIKITLINDDLDGITQSQTIFEVTTKMPKLVIEDENTIKNFTGENTTTNTQTTQSVTIPSVKADAETTHDITLASTSHPENNISSKTDAINDPTSTTTVGIEADTQTNMNISTEIEHADPTTSATMNAETTVKVKLEVRNITEVYNEDDEKNSTVSSEEIDDFQSPLLSAASEPLHRPNRSRRPQPVNRISKFNPFRILG